ncbi:glycosyltransferase family 39 protein [Streptomyces sp. NPDC005423]|uniref:glycosyltransferase family 39 protein n=1 Tax=Streptomyces sp. NPDC005423 TaxID=3155343 RepID=UPI0033BF8558
MCGLGLWGIDRGGMWRDEAVTAQVARRSVPQIWRLLHGVDAVHGVYYLLMHVVLAVRPGEVALRLPSVGAAALTAGLVAAIGARLARPRVGLWAGLLYAVTPMTGHYAQEGRSYALVAAGAAGATLLLLRALEGRSWWPYGLVVAATCLLHELAVLVLLAHAVTLALARVPARTWRGWAYAGGGAVLVLLPLAVVSHGQARQVAWLTAPDGEQVRMLLHAFTGPTRAVRWTYAGLVGAALAEGWRRRPSVVGVALPWAVLPPALLMTVSQVRPLYDDRYVLYALAGVPLLAAAGADRLVTAAGRLRRAAGSGAYAAFGACTGSRGGVDTSAGPGTRAGATPVPVLRALRAVPVLRVLRVVRVLRTPRLPLAALLGALAVALSFVHQFPAHREDRWAGHRPDNLAAVSALAARELRPGDPVLFLPALGRRSEAAYPGGFRKGRDVALATPGAESGTLYGREVGVRALRRRLAPLDRLWVFAEPYALDSPWYPSDPTERLKLTVVGEEFVPQEQFVRRGVTLRLYVRRPTAVRPADGSAADRDAADGDAVGGRAVSGDPAVSPGPPRRAPW